MVQNSPGGDSHEQFINWVKSRGVKINGVRPAYLDGRGMAIVADRTIKVHSCQQSPYIDVGQLKPSARLANSWFVFLLPHS